MNVLTTTRRAGAAPPAMTPAAPLPITIDPPRGGVYAEAARPAAVGGRSAREIALSSIATLLSPNARPAPTREMAVFADAAVTRLRGLVANAVVTLRARVGSIAHELGDDQRVAVEDWALMLPIDEGAMLERVLGLLSPADVLAAGSSAGGAALATIARVAETRVEGHLLGLLRHDRRLSETTKASVLFALANSAG